MNIGYFNYGSHKINIIKTKTGFIFTKENNKPFNEQEKSLIKIVNNMLTINNKTSKFVKKIKLNKNYNLYYDFKSKNYFWISEDNIYNEIDNKILNFNFNHQEEILYDKNSPNINNQNFYKKLINFANKTIIIFLASTIALSMNFPEKELPNEIVETIAYKTIQTIEETIPNEIEETIVCETTPNEIIYIYDFKDIENAIDKNPNLSEEEKNIIKSTKFVFDENYMYMDIDLILERLQTLKIEYNHNFDSLYTKGSYSLTDNVIKLRSSKIEGNIQEFIHEYLHVLQRPHNSFLMELSNQFFTNETIIKLYEEKLLDEKYFISSNENKEYTEYEKNKILSINKTFERGYMGYTGIYYMLAEILPEHTLREFQFNPTDIEIIINGLEEVEPNKDFVRIFNLVLEICSIRAYNEETLKWEYKKDITEVYNLLNELCKDIKGTYIIESPELTYNYMIEDSHLINKEENIEKEYELLKDFIKTYTECYYVLRLPKTYLSDIRNNSILVYKEPDSEEIKYLEIDEQFEKEFIEYKKLNSEQSLTKQKE